MELSLAYVIRAVLLMSPERLSAFGKRMNRSLTLGIIIPGLIASTLWCVCYWEAVSALAEATKMITIYS